MVSFKDVIDRVRSVFRRERKQIEQAIELQKGVSQPMGFDTFSIYGRYGMEPLMDYLRIEQELITRFLDYAEMESVSGDTRVMTVWGEMTVLEILDRCNRDPKFIPFVFSYDREKKELVVAPALKPAKTGENKPMFRITFNNGRSLKVTGDHLVMMRDASYRPVKELKVGDRLMPFYSDVSSDGYVRVRQPDQKEPAGNDKKTFVHRMVAECLLRRKLRSDEDVDHYPDHTRTNNDPSNLVVRPDYEHHARHGLVFRVKNTPECARRKKISRTLKKKVWTDNYTLRMAIKHIRNDGIPFDEWIKERRGGRKALRLLPESHRDAIARGRAKKFDALLTKERVIETLEKCASVNEAATLLGVWWGVLDRRIRQYGIDRKEVLGRKLLVTGGNGNNHRVIKIEPCGSEPTYDIPVPKYHNFVAETVVIHNSYPELSAALDIWADEACITADTEIPMLDGSVKTVGELYAAGAKKKWVYGFDPVRARVVAAQFDRVEKIADQCKILKITYQDKFGKVGYLKVTPDHKFLLVNGKYVRSGELNVGDKLMGLIKFQFKDEGRHQWYENVLVRPFAKQWQSTHRMVLDSVGVHVPNGWHVHHEDLNGLNNDPSNLKPLSHEDHLKKHDVRGEKNPRFRHDITWESVDKVLKKTGFISAKELGCILGCGARVILRIAKQRGYKNWSDLKDSLFGLKKNSYGRDHRPETRARYEVLLSQVLEYARVNPLAPFAVFRERFGSAVEEMLKFFNYSGWNDFRKKHNLPILKKTESVLADNAANHTVISIEELPPEDVYDLVNSLPTHNFAAGNGGTWVFVKNTQPDILTGRTVWVESDDVQVKKLLQDLIDTNLEIDEEIWSIARGLCKYGNHFEEVLPTPEGVIGINALPPETVRRYEKSKGLLIGYAQDPRGVFGVTVDDIDQVIQGKQAPPPGMNVFEPWQLVHFRLIGRTRPSVYGVGVLEAARWIWRRLLLLEDAALIYRLTRTPTRWIFYIDVGKLPPNQALGHVRRIKNEFTKQKLINEKGCLTGETCVELLTGEIKTMRELAECGKDVWVYAYDLKRNMVVPAKARAPRKTSEHAPVWKIVLDNGALIRCTPDHRFLLRNGEWCEAKDLKRGSSLMPFHLMRAGIGELPYAKVKHVGLGQWQFVHTLVAEELLDRNYREKGLLVHHAGSCLVPGHKKCSGKNCKLNNAPENLRLETFAGHAAHHNKETEASRVLGFLSRVREDASFRWQLGRRMARNNRLWMLRTKGVRRQILEILSNKVCSNPDWSLSEYADWMNSNEDVLRLHRSIRKSTKLISGSTIFNWIKRCGYTGVDDFKRDCLPRRKKVQPNGKYNRWNPISVDILKKACSGSFRISDVARKLGINWTNAKKNLDKYGLKPEFSKAKANNHKVIWVGPDGFDDVYDLTVDGYENFALTAGVFAHNSVDLRYNALSSDENLFIPVVDGKRTTEVDLMATPEWQVMDDLNYFRDKLFSAIKIPKAYLGYEEASRARLLSLEDVRFARSIMRVQRELRNGLRKICKIHLATLGIDPEKVNFDVFMTVPSWAYELAQLEVRNAKAEFADRVRTYLSERAIMKAIFGFSDDEIDAIRRERAEEDSGGGAPPGGDQRVRRKKAEGNSVLDLPGMSRVAKDEDNQIKAINEHLAEISKTNKYIAQKIEGLKDYGRDLRSGMFFRSGNGKSRLVASQGRDT